MTMTAMTRMGVWMPNGVAWPTGMANTPGSLLTPCSPVRSNTAPLTTLIVPSVVMSGLTPRRAITRPLTSPTQAPTSTPSTIATTTGVPLPKERPVTLPANAITAPTERSNPPETRRMVIPTATMASKLLLCLGGREVARHAPPGHDQDAMAERENLRQLRRDQHNAHAGVGQAAHQLVDLRLGAHVDAARGLVDDQQARLPCQPHRQQDLLLVAAAQGADARSRAGRADVQRAQVILGHAAGRAVAHKAAAAERGQVGCRDILHHRHQQEEPFLFALLRQIGNAVRNGIARRVEGNLPTIQENLA